MSSPTIATYSGAAPVLSGQLTSGLTITAGSETDTDENSSLTGAFSDNSATLFKRTGWNSVFFNTVSPITFTSYKIWLAEDYQIGNRAAAKVKIYGSQNLSGPFTLIDEVDLTVPYFTAYGSDAITASNTVQSTTYQFFELSVLGHDWGQGGDGPRILGFQIV